MTKVQKLKRASTAFWWLSSFMTFMFIYSVVKESDFNPVIAVGMSAGISLLLQYGISLAESALFDGSVPAPWAIDWKAGGPLPWIMVGAMVCLIVDVGFNIGGVNYFVSKLERTGIESVGFTDYAIGITKLIMTVAMATLTAIGSELLDEYAAYIEGSRGRVKEHRQAPRDEGRVEGRPMNDEAEAARLKALRATVEKNARRGV